MKRMMGFVVLAGLLAAGYHVRAQDVPGGWKVLKDKKGTCQMAVPSDWVANAVLPGAGSSPDNRASSTVHGADPSQSFADAKAMVKQIMQPTTLIEDSDKRLWYAYEGNSSGNGVIYWYAAVPGKPVCALQVNFKSPVSEDTAKKIVMSLAAAH